MFPRPCWRWDLGTTMLEGQCSIWARGEGGQGAEDGWIMGGRIDRLAHTEKQTTYDSTTYTT